MIPVNQPLMAKNALKYVSDCINSGWISSAGSYVGRFENQFAEYLGVKHAITTTSGTSALHLALAAADIGPGDEVIIPALTMIAVPYAVLYTGAAPLLVDVDPEIYNLHPDRIREVIQDTCQFDGKKNSLVNKKTGRTVKAILPVHLYGHPCQMDKIMAIALEYNLLIIEDAAEAHGAQYFLESDRQKARYAGTLGDVGCFSFYANKIISTGEGGMVVTDNDHIADKARRLKDLAHSSEKRFLHTDLAFNYRMTNLQAAVGLAQLEEIERFIRIKQEMAAAYRELLSEVEGLTLPQEKSWARNVYWMYAVLAEDDFGLSRDELSNLLKQQGVDTRTFFISVHRQPVFAKDDHIRSQSFPVSDELARKGFYLPSGLALTRDQIKQTCQTIKDIQAGLRPS